MTRFITIGSVPILQDTVQTGHTVEVQLRHQSVQGAVRKTQACGFWGKNEQWAKPRLFAVYQGNYTTQLYRD